MVERIKEGDGRVSNNSNNESYLGSDSEELGPCEALAPCSDCHGNELPEGYSHLATKCSRQSVILKQFVINDYLLVPVTPLENLVLTWYTRRGPARLWISGMHGTWQCLS